MELNKEKNFISAIAYLYDDEDKVIPFFYYFNPCKIYRQQKGGKSLLLSIFTRQKIVIFKN